MKTTVNREQALFELQRRQFAPRMNDKTGVGVLLTPGSRTIHDVPNDVLISLRVRMYALGALVWDYVDTVLDLARQMRRPELKKLCRAVRELHEDYDSVRRANADAGFFAFERKWALDFEAFVEPLSARFIDGLKKEQSEAVGEMEAGTYWLMMAVQQALCVLEALHLYARGCDMAIERYGVDMRDKTILPRHFRSLEVLLPEFGGDTLVRSQARHKAASAIAVELAKIAVSDRDGDLDSPEMDI